MRERPLFSVILFVLSISLFTFCAGSKNIQKVDGPDDYYEPEASSQPSSQNANDSKTAATEEKSVSPKSTSPQAEKPAPSPAAQTKAESPKPANNKNQPVQETQSLPVKVEENPLPQEIQEELGDDNWAKDDNKVKIRKKDKEKIKDSPPDDDKWGKE